MTFLLVSWLSVMGLASRPDACTTTAPPAAPVVLTVAATTAADGAAMTASGQSSGSSSSHSRGNGPHEWGIGGMIGAGALGSGVGLRYWFLGHVGVDMRFLLSSGSLGGFVPGGGFSIEAAPSIIVLLKTPDFTKAADFRPYVGAGTNWTRAGANADTTGQGVSGTGTQFFGGVEVGFSEAGPFALSGEISYGKRSASLVDAGVKGGVAGVVAFHLYVK